MKSLSNYIIEVANEPSPTILKFYRANIGKTNEKGDVIGDVVELSYKFYSNYNKCFVFGRPDKTGKDWVHALDIQVSDNETRDKFDKFLTKLNKKDNFYQYYIDKNEASRVAAKAAKTNNTSNWTLKTLLDAIKKDKDLMSLKHNYCLAIACEENTECVYVSRDWRIFVFGGKIYVKRKGWHTYIVPNLQSLYKVISADSDSDDDETTRQYYSVLA